jgi:hypothetical protein
VSNLFFVIQRLKVIRAKISYSILAICRFSSKISSSRLSILLQSRFFCVLICRRSSAFSRAFWTLACRTFVNCFPLICQSIKGRIKVTILNKNKPALHSGLATSPLSVERLSVAGSCFANSRQF